MIAASLDRATVAIVGVGLMGGSLGAALAGCCGRRIGAWMPGHAPGDGGRSWLEAGLVDEVGVVDEVVGRADIVVLAMPACAIIDAIPKVAARMRPESVLTDVGSTKRAIIAAMDACGDEVACIGGHPMCGREVSGSSAADASLFAGATWALCPAQSSTSDARELARGLVRAVGGRVLEIDAGEHDRVVALTSHVPYVIGQALTHALDARQGVQESHGGAGLAGGGLRDATRLAAGDVTMWADVLTTNPDEVAIALDELDVQLSQLRELLAPARRAQREAWLAAGRERARSLRSSDSQGAR